MKMKHNKFRKSIPTLYFIYAILIGLICVTSQQASAQINEAEKIKLLDQALRAQADGDLKAAKKAVDRLQVIDPNDVSIQRLAKTINEDLGINAPSGSRSSAGSSGGVAPAKRAAIIAQAIDERDKGNIAGAKRLLQDLIAQNPSDVKAVRLLDNLESAKSAGPYKRTGSSASRPSVPGAASASRPAPSSAAPARSSTGMALRQETARQSGLISHTVREVNLAIKQADETNYKEVIGYLNETQNRIPVNTATVNTLKSIQVKKIQLALKMLNNGQKDARAIATDGLNEYKELFGAQGDYPKLKGMVERDTNNPYNLDIKEISPEWSANYEVAQDLLVKARAQQIFGDLKGAQQTLQQIEARDANNAEAKGMQIKIAETINKNGEIDRKKTRAQMIEEVNRAWQRPQIYEVVKEDTGVFKDVSRTLEKLRSIKVPYFEVSDGTSLSDAIEMIDQLAVQNDNTTDDPLLKGINFVLADPEGKNPDLQKVKLSNSRLDQILQVVTDSVEFQYTIKNKAVFIMPGGGGRILPSKTFSISRATELRLTGITNAGGGGGGGGFDDDPFADSSGSDFGGGGSGAGNKEKEDAIKNFFLRNNIPFDGNEGASLAYDGTQLFITQTTKNLERIERILQRYDETKQVEVEAKFIEVQQGKLEELGFQWNLQRAGRGPTSSLYQQDFFNTSNSTGTNLRTIPGTFSVAGSSRGDGLLTQADTTNTVETTVFTNISPGFSANDLTTNAAAFAPTVVTDQDGLISEITTFDFVTSSNSTVEDISNVPPTFPNLLNLATGSVDNAAWSMILGDWQAQLTIRALEQEQGTDLMSAPRVTVLSGNTAIITVSQKLMYPTNYGDIEAEVDNQGAAAITPGTPQDFETEDIGVILNVTPEVEENNSINLKLNPRVAEFEGFVEYGGKAIAIAGSTSVTVPAGFFMPVFSIREVSTEVTVYDGATIVLGGLAREEVKSINDKIPVLGDIPLIGRLFKSEGETRQKRNLLIFVSANLISPGGSPSKQSYRSVQANALFQNPVIVTPSGAMGRNVTTSSEISE